MVGDRTRRAGIAAEEQALGDARAEIVRQLRRLVPAPEVVLAIGDRPLRDEVDLGPEGLAPLLAVDTGIVVEPDECPTHLTLGDLARQLVERRERAHWRIDVSFSVDGRRRTTARARLTAGLDHLVGLGTATKHPADPDVPDVAAEVAAARALADLSHQLLAVAGGRISEWDDDAAPLRA